MNMFDKRYCMSSYLTFRYVVREDIGWTDDCRPRYPVPGDSGQTGVNGAGGVDAFIEEYINANVDNNTGIFLSGGIDSAILASYLPKGTQAYVIRFVADGAIDESVSAQRYADRYKLDLTIVDVSWEDYGMYSQELMKNKKSPLHAVEVGLYKAAKTAKDGGVNKIILGNGADSTFGGMDKLLSKDWKFDEFVKRYSFVDSSSILRDPVSVADEYEKYRIGADRIDYVSFLKRTHGTGIIQAFDNAIGLAGCTSLEPYEEMVLDAPLDLDRIRKGEPKYMLTELFKKKYPNMDPPGKIPFARPMEQWLGDWSGPVRDEFKDRCVDGISGDQKYLVYCLEDFLNTMGM